MSYIHGRLQNVPNVNDIQKQINELNDKTTELETTKQDKLVSGKNIKTVDGNSIVGSGNVPFKTINGEKLSGEGNIDIHNEPLTIKTGTSQGDIVYDGSAAAEVTLVSPIIVDPNPLIYNYDSQLIFYRNTINDKGQLGPIYYTGVNEPITTCVQVPEGRVPEPPSAEWILKIFTAPFADIFVGKIEEIETSSKALVFTRTSDPEEDAPYLQFGNGNDASGWIKLKLNKKQAYLYIKAKMFQSSDCPGSLFVVEDLSKLANIDFNASEHADKLVFNYTEALVTSEEDWQIIKVPIQSESQTVYITNGRNFGTPSGPSTTYDYKRDELGHIIWTRDPETGEIIGGQIDRNHELYGGRILIKEIGVQYEEELGIKTLFTAEQFNDYAVAAERRFTDIEAVNEAQSSYLDEIDTHLSNVEEEFTEKFNNLGDVQIYTVDELPEQVHIDDEHKIYKCNGHYYTVVFSPEGSNNELFEFAGNSHTFDNNITSVASLVNSFTNIYNDSGDNTLQYYFWIPEDSITQANKLFGSREGSFGEYLGEQYLRFGARNYGGKLILDYKDNGDSRALTNITFSILPWINIVTETDPDTGETVKYIGSLSNSAIKIYRASEDNLIGAVLLEGATFEPYEYEYSQEGFDSLIADNKTDYTLNVQLMPGDRIIIKSDNNIGEDTGLDYRFFILGLNLELEETEVSFKEPFVTTDTNQDNISGAKTFTGQFTVANYSGISLDCNGYGISASDALYLYGYKKINDGSTFFGTTSFENTVDFNDTATFNNSTIFNGNSHFESDITVKENISNGFDKAISVSEISTATNLENGNGAGSIIQGNVELGDITWTSSDTDIATVDENGNVEAIGEGNVIITAIAENGASDECELTVINPNRRARVQLRGFGPSTTVTNTITVLTAENEWVVSSGSTIGDIITEFTLLNSDDIITISTTGNPNCGTIWGTATNDWRLYQNQAGNVIATAAEGYVIDSITYTYTTSNGGILKDGDIQVSSGTTITVNAQSKELIVGNTGDKTNGQVKITAITVVYKSYEPTLVEEIVLAADDITLNAGEQFDLEPDVLPIDADNRDISCTSDDESVATVDSFGIIRAISEGEAIITVAAVDGSGVFSTCTVTVNAGEIKEIQLNVNSATVNLGDTIKLSAKYKDKNIADGALSIALGLENEVNGDLSFVQGDHLVAEEDGQVIFGSYNAETESKFVIAAGTANNRFNAFEVTSNGKAIAGLQTEEEDDDNVLTTKSYVDGKTDFSDHITIGGVELNKTQLEKLLALLDTLEAKDIE